MWSKPNLSLTSPSITVPINKGITISPEWVDIGRKYIVTLAPTHCEVVKNTDVIDNASVYFYSIASKTWTCRNLASIDDYMTRSGTSWEHTEFRR